MAVFTRADSHPTLYRSPRITDQFRSSKRVCHRKDFGKSSFRDLHSTSGPSALTDSLKTSPVAVKLSREDGRARHKQRVI